VVAFVASALVTTKIGTLRDVDEQRRALLRAVSHDLRTPLSAMAGWLHLLESGTLDAAGTKRAITKLRGNIDEQVRTIERYLGNIPEGSRS